MHGRNNRPSRILGLSMCIALSYADAACAGSLSDGGFTVLNGRVGADKASFYIYQDADSGFNHGFPSGFFGAKLFKQPNPACIDDPTAADGCSTDPNSLDRQHGTVFQINFLPQTPGNFSGLDFEEPQGFLSSMSGNGYNLTGASRIVFQVRSPTGIRVQFGAGGGTTQFVTIPASTSYAQACIALPGASPTVCSDSTYQLQTAAFALKSVNILFTIVTNDVNAPNGGVLLLDDIRFDPVPPMPQPIPFSLPLSTQTFGVVPSATAAGAPPDQANRNVAAIYEASVAAIALFARGQVEDIANGLEIADALVYALGHDNQGDPLPVAADGARGLHNAYESGDLALLNSQGPVAGQAGQVRLAGFSVTSTDCGPSQYCLVLDGATGGNNAFAVLALVKAFAQSGQQRYLDAAVVIGNWIYEQLLDRSGTGFGGYFLGYPDMGLAKVLQTSKSTENNADIFAAFSALGEVDRAASHMWRARAKIARDFVIAMFDKQQRCFDAGTVPAGTMPQFGVDPTGPQRGNDVINRFGFLDAQTFPYLAIPRPMESLISNRRPRLSHPSGCLDRFRASVNAAGTTFAGYDLVVPSTEPNGMGGVAWEFTGQAAAVIFRSGKDPTPVLDAMRVAQAQAPFDDGNGLVDATLEAGDTLPPINQCLPTPFQCIPERVGIAASTWGIFAELGVNPFQ